MFLLLLLCILLAWFLSQKLYARYWCNGLSVEIEFQERFLYEGDTSAMKEIVDMGVRLIGGCCGTTPEFIRSLHDLP